MKIHFDEQADALYFRLDNSAIVETEEVRPGVILDFNDRDQVVGVEILGIKSRVPLARLREVYIDLGSGAAEQVT